MNRSAPRAASFARLAIGLVALAVASSAVPCSTVTWSGPGGMILARNADAEPPLPGLLVVNKRGVAKRAMAWSIIGPAPAHPTADWVSRYGSVTVTALGREFPDGGQNERGLAIEEMTLLETAYPRRTERPRIPHMQWIQYQLDNFATVDEVVANVDRYDLTGWTWHFMVADVSGACATIEFLKGTPVVERGRIGGLGCVLTNNVEAEARAALPKYQGFGGELAIPTGGESLSRYVRGASLLNSAGESVSDPIEFGFEVLGRLAVGPYTIRSIVHDLTRGRLYFRSPTASSIKFVDLRRLNFSAESPVTVLDFDTPGEGDVTDRLRPYTRSDQERIVRTFFDQVILKHEAARQLLAEEAAGAGIDQATHLQRLIDYPDQLR